MAQWTDIYMPHNLDAITGNGEAIRTLKEWADSWVGHDPKKKAVVLHGAVGVGKTCSALALANDYGWSVIELNTSDKRNDASIREIAMLGSSLQTFDSSGEYRSTEEGGYKLILFDEVDNLSGKEDRGGIRAILDTIKKTKHPVILTVNDSYALTRLSQEISRLCLFIKYKGIDRRLLRRTATEICRHEGITISGDAISRVVENNTGDMRAFLTDLQTVCVGRTEVTADDVHVGPRDPKEVIFKALVTIFKRLRYEKS